MIPDLPPLDPAAVHCGTDFLQTRPARGARPPVGGPKQARDLYELPGEALSENFAFRWGDGIQVSDDDALTILQHFEDSWAHQVEGWDYPPPEDSEGALFNVYLGSSGDGAPDDYGFGGYFSYDAQGYPLIVLNRQSVSDPDAMYMVISHEFFHAIQGATDGYQYTGRAAWYFEATAVWASGEMYPSDESHASFLIGYAYLPQLPIHYFDYPDTGILDEYHQYGAFIFPQFLTEHLADPGLVRDSWVDPSDSDPLVVLDGLLRDDWGADIESAFADFASHNATWDYARGDAYQGWEDAYETFWPERKLLDVHGSWSGGWIEVTGELAPRRFGSNFIQLRPDGQSDVVVGFRGEPAGSGDSPARWWATLVTESGGGVRYHPLALTDGAFGEQALPDTAGSSLAWLVVSATSEAAGDSEQFSYSYTLGTEPEPIEYGEVTTLEDTVEKPGGCGCAGVGAASRVGGSVWLLLLAGLARRRL